MSTNEPRPSQSGPGSRVPDHEEELGKGPSAHGFEDERWTLVRVQTVIRRRRLRLSLSVATVWRLLKRHDWSWQAPARRALERDEQAVELWKMEVWPKV
ncbi:winged helix-turn-helix domain-containing protein [Streptomyces sp. NPDC058611]|uniref:helix-turn-helix domain-containing protein n=1 Tax=unclassified Streptomyces TaxID=2593676 RepID=UPI003648816E